MIWIGSNLKNNLVLTPCHGQGCHSLDHIAQALSNLALSQSSFHNLNIECSDGFPHFKEDMAELKKRK